MRAALTGLWLLASGFCSAATEECCGGGFGTIPTPGERQPGVLRITADPNNLPFSNSKFEGFENELAQLIARELGVKLEWTWRAQRRGFFRETLKESTADLILGAPAGYERALTTKPYYRSSYVFVSREDRQLDISSFDDPRLKTLKIGVQIIGDDGASTPPAHALARRGITQNLVGFSVLGDYSQPNPPARIVEAAAAGEVDLAVVWGPLAGYFASRTNTRLKLAPVTPASDPPGLRFNFAIAMGVRKGDTELKEKLDALLERKRPEIEQILDRFGIPRVAAPPSAEHAQR